MKQAKRHPLIFGTMILTATGLITRVIGFFYRIYLSRLFGEEGMGIYQLLSPALSPFLFPDCRRLPDRHLEICGGG